MEAEKLQCCEVCGEHCRTEPGAFGLPVRNPLSGMPITGICCPVCGPKIVAFCNGDCRNLEALPDGPLKAFLYRVQHATIGMNVLALVEWLAEECATVAFAPTSVTVTTRDDCYTAPTLAEAVRTLQQKEAPQCVTST